MEAVAARETKELQRREKPYRRGLPAAELRDRTVVLVDDGLATGSTMEAAVEHVRAAGPWKVIIAVPVASPEAWIRVLTEADDYVCLAKPEPFHSVGEWYADFR